MGRITFDRPKRTPRPTIYDIAKDVRRPATQADVDRLVERAGEAVSLRMSLLQLLELPPNAKWQIDRIAACGGVYALTKDIAA